MAKNVGSQASSQASSYLERSTVWTARAVPNPGAVKYKAVAKNLAGLIQRGKLAEPPESSTGGISLHLTESRNLFAVRAALKPKLEALLKGVSWKIRQGARTEAAVSAKPFEPSTEVAEAASSSVSAAPAPSIVAAPPPAPTFNLLEGLLAGSRNPSSYSKDLEESFKQSWGFRGKFGVALRVFNAGKARRLTDKLPGTINQIAVTFVVTASGCRSPRGHALGLGLFPQRGVER